MNEYSDDTYMLWARLIVRFGLSKREADEWVGFDTVTRKYPTNVELFYLNEAYREKLREPGTAEYNIAIICQYLNNYLKGKATVEDFLPYSQEERDSIEDAKMQRDLAAWANAANRALDKKSE